ncbi:hypothetical protein C5167_037080 [Papaver somniferum]|uniref:Uncharacterized protein n=1 Tax=Papaver somniferum TaxID=3469 RepID=A0A4Y7I5R1_PAPSO|nr:hypothetical protein C5167_037080 [Papaver somniferum]
MVVYHHHHYGPLEEFPTWTSTGRMRTGFSSYSRGSNPMGKSDAEKENQWSESSADRSVGDSLVVFVLHTMPSPVSSRSQDWRNKRRARSRELVTQVGDIKVLNTGRVSPGRYWCARYVDLPIPSWELSALSGRRLGLCDHYSGGHCVRLVSQSNEHLPLLTVEGLRADVPQFRLSLVSRVS